MMKDEPDRNKSEVRSRKFDLEDRLIDYAVRIIKVVQNLPNTEVCHHISTQLLKSGTSAAANYGEAQSAESRKDFIHKVKIALKELRESKIWLKIILIAELILPASKLTPLLEETDELISILFSSARTAQNRKSNK